MPIDARSEPIPGSVMATAVIASPEQIVGNHRRFCSSFVRSRKYGIATSLWSVIPRPAPPAPALAISSLMMRL